MGTAIGTSRVIAVHANWHEGPRLHEAVVGDPGTQNSPAMKPAMKPLLRQQEAAERTDHDTQSFHEADMTRHAVDMEGWRKDAKAGTSAPRTPTSAPDAPTMSRRWASTSTVEALARLLKDHPRGILLSQDDCTAWARGMDQSRNGQGADRPFG